MSMTPSPIMPVEKHIACRDESIADMKCKEPLATGAFHLAPRSDPTT
jgi:hypothetical protein